MKALQLIQSGSDKIAIPKIYGTLTTKDKSSFGLDTMLSEGVGDKAFWAEKLGVEEDDLVISKKVSVQSFVLFSFVQNHLCVACSG